jgi:FAD/FMN-containing dehydrogenases
MKNLLKDLTGIVGDDNIVASSIDRERYSIDGKKPEVVVLPRNVEEVSEILKLASRESVAIIPWGAGTKMGLGKGTEKGRGCALYKVS